MPEKKSQRVRQSKENTKTSSVGLMADVEIHHAVRRHGVCCRTKTGLKLERFGKENSGIMRYSKEWKVTVAASATIHAYLP